MIVFVTSAVSLILLAVICYDAFKDTPLPDEKKDRTASLLLGSAVLSLIVDYVMNGISADMMMVEILPPLICMLMQMSPLSECSRVSFPVPVSLALSAIPVLVNICVASGWCVMPSPSLFHCTIAVYVLIATVIYAIALVRYLRDVRQVLKTGTVWFNVGLAVDAAYVVILLLISLGYIAVSVSCRGEYAALVLIFPFLAGGMLAATGMRRADDSLFVFWHSQERRIVESMKVTKVETASDPSCIDDVYRDIYERVVAYFDSEKPFLDNELTINDLAKVLYSNKLYISRAISQFTGRNFCQFVNYYRVVHSMEVFRDNPDMRIHELAGISGFNSDVSYNMAFRLFMGETPGEWCKKERNRKLKMKK